MEVRQVGADDDQDIVEIPHRLEELGDDLSRYRTDHHRKKREIAEDPL